MRNPRILAPEIHGPEAYRGERGGGRPGKRTIFLGSTPCISVNRVRMQGSVCMVPCGRILRGCDVGEEGKKQVPEATCKKPKDIEGPRTNRGPYRIRHATSDWLAGHGIKYIIRCARRRVSTCTCITLPEEIFYHNDRTHSFPWRQRGCCSC